VIFTDWDSWITVMELNFIFSSYIVKPMKSKNFAEVQRGLCRLAA